MCGRPFLCYSFAVESEHQQIEELKQLVRRNIELSQDIAKTVHSMYRTQRWSSVFRVVRILVLIVVAGGLYLYLQPYADQIRAAYEQIKNFVPGGN